MGGRMPAAWWRAYRASHRDAIAETDRRRRQQDKVKAQRQASETRRRQRIRLAELAKTVPLEHPLLAWAAEVVPYTRPSDSLWRYPLEALVEDLRSEAILARLEGRDAEEAVRAYRSRELQWLCLTCQPVENVA